MKKPTKHLPLIIGLSFLLVVYVLLLVFENELLFRSQELSLWLPTEMWFQRRMSYPAGFLTVVATFLNQFMFYPWLGALLLVGLWLAVYLLTLKVFRIPSHRAALALIPVSLLIGCALEVGYWIFLTNHIKDEVKFASGELEQTTLRILEILHTLQFRASSQCRIINR